MQSKKTFGEENITYRPQIISPGSGLYRVQSASFLFQKW